MFWYQLPSIPDHSIEAGVMQDVWADVMKQASAGQALSWGSG
jgi:hypothetical protein